jgi:hypothetical protein
MFCLVEGIKLYRELYNREHGASERTEAFFCAQLGRLANSPLRMKEKQLTPRKSIFLPLSDCANFIARIRHQPAKMMARHENSPDTSGCNLTFARFAQGQL